MVQQSLGSLAPVLQAAFGLSHAQVGLSFSVVLGGALVATAISGIAVDRWGERRMIFWSGIGMGVALVAASAIPRFAWFVAWMFVFGIGYAASTPAGGRAILLWFARDRGFAMGVRQTGVSLGGFIGALYLPAAALAAGYRFALITSGIMCAAICMAAATLYHEPEGARGEGTSFRVLLGGMARIARDKRAVMLNATCILLVCAQSCTLTFVVTALANQLQARIEVAALALAFVQAGAMAGRMLWGWVSDRFFDGDRALPLALLCVGVSAIVYALSWIAPGLVVVALVMAFVLGLTAVGWNGLFAAAQTEIAGPQLAGSALGVGLTWLFAMGFVAPPIFGAIVDAHGFPFAWRALAAALLAGVVPALLARKFIREGAAA